MTQRVVAITGIGTLTPAGRGTGALWTRIASGETCIAPIDPQKYFDPSMYACQVAGQVPSFTEPRVQVEQIMTQTDRCSQMAMVAVLDALEMAKLPMDFRSEDSPVASECVSLTVGTNIAGWPYLEREMKNLWMTKSMDRYGLTAGFLAGPQGHVSIFFGIEGGIRSFVSERIGGAYALIEGARAIQSGDAEVAIAGGTEAPLSPLSWAAYHSAYTLSSTAQSENQPFGEHTGMLIGEGSTFLVLEEREHALRRGVPILAEIRAWSRGTDPYPLQGSSKQPGRGLTQIIHKSLARADIQPTAVDVIFPAGPSFAVQENSAEETAINNVFGQPSSIAMSKAVLGHLQGAAVATDVAIAALALDHQLIPPTQDALLPSHLSARNECQDSPMKHALILSSGVGGTHASLIISKSE